MLVLKLVQDFRRNFESYLASRMVNHLVHVGHLFVRIAGISGALAVGLGAYGAHGKLAVRFGPVISIVIVMIDDSVKLSSEVQLTINDHGQMVTVQK